MRDGAGFAETVTTKLIDPYNRREAVDLCANVQLLRYELCGIPGDPGAIRRIATTPLAAALVAHGANAPTIAPEAIPGSYLWALELAFELGYWCAMDGAMVKEPPA